MPATARRVGRPRTRTGGEASYVGFRAPRELKERLEAEATRNGRSISTETQIRVEKSFERQDILTDALSLAYGPRLAGVFLLLLSETAHAGQAAAFASLVEPFDNSSSGAKSLREALELQKNWMDNPYSYDQAIQVALTVLQAFRPPGDPNTLRDGRKAETPLWVGMVVEKLAALREPALADRRAQEAEGLPLSSMLLQAIRIEHGAEQLLRGLLGPLVERIPYVVNREIQDA